MASIDSIIGSIGSGASAGSGVTGFLDSIFGWSAKRQFKQTQQLMDKQYEQQMSMYERQLADQLAQWNRENEYNDPTNAYKRLVAGLDANGLNKALAIGGASGGVTASSGHNSSVPSPGGTGLGSASLLPMGSVTSLANLRQRAEISNIEANTEKVRKEAGFVDAQTTSEQLKWSVLDAQHTLLQLSGKNTAADTALKNANRSFVQLQEKRYDEITDSQIKSNLSSVVQAMSSFMDANTRRNLSAAQQSQMMAAAQMYISSAVLNAAKTQAEKMLTEKYGAEVAHQKMDNQLFAMTFSHLAESIRNKAALSGVDVVKARKENWWLHVDKVTQNAENLAKAFYYICSGIDSGDGSDSLGAVSSFINGMNAEDAIGAASVVF